MSNPSSSLAAHSPSFARPLSRRALLAAVVALLAGVAVALGVTVLFGQTGSTGGSTPRAADVPGTEAAVHGLATLPLAARLAVSRELGGQLARFEVSRSAGGYAARNAANRFTASFGEAGATITTAGRARASIELQAIGFGTALRAVPGAAQPLVEAERGANRVEYRRAGVTEWFANGPAGLEQGFTVARAPAGKAGARSAGAPLTLDLRVHGALRARWGASGEIGLDTASGQPVLSYGELSVTDATGRALPARLTLEHGVVAIRIVARGAHYPLTVDPLVQSAELYASNGKQEDYLGWSVAVYGHTIVAGAPHAEVEGKNSGAAYVFTEGADGWASATQTTELMQDPATSEALFGTSVAISGKTVVVGAYGVSSGSGVDAGAAYVYTEPSGGWKAGNQDPAAELINSEDVAEYSFGESVAISGKTILVGAPLYRNYVYTGPAYSGRYGAAFIFEEPSGGWEKASKPMVQTATLTLSEPQAIEAEELTHFGSAVALDELDGVQTAAVGAYYAKEEGTFQQGGVYVFNRPAGGWASAHTEYHPGAVLQASTAKFGQHFGHAVAISGEHIVVGDGEGEGKDTYEGGAYVFNEPSGGWTSQASQTAAAKLYVPGAVADWEVGRSVAIDGAQALVTADGDAWVYAMPLGGWTGEPHPTANSEGYAWSVALENGNAIVGGIGLAPPEGKGHSDQGGVLVYPLGPEVETAGASVLSSSAATVEGAIDPNKNSVSSCVFQYGTTDSYGSEVPCSQSVGAPPQTTAVSAALSGLQPSTTYHYRLLGTNADGTSYGLDATFTTAAGETGKTETKEEPKTTTNPTTTSPTTTSPTATSPAATTTTTPGGPGVTPTSGALESTRALACTTAQVALIDVVPQGSQVLITGAARQVLAGKHVTIKLLSTGKVVATPTVTPAGTFTATVPLPPSKVRYSNRTRYQASVGALSSLALKLERRAYMLHATLSGSHVEVAGRVTGSFRAGTPVRITLRVTCALYKTVATVKLTKTGAFSATVPAPTGAASQIAVYRAATTVLTDGHPFPTFTLPTPPS
jgi:hypothetical protein